MAERFVVVASIGASHGVHGEMRVKSFTAEPLAFASYGLLTDRTGRRFEVTGARVIGDRVVARIKGVETREQAAALAGVELLAPRAALPAAGEDDFYLADLIGLPVVTVAGQVFGKITAVNNFGAGDILEIARESGSTEWFAFTRRNFPEVDPAAGRIVIDPPAMTEAKPDAT